MAEGPHEGGRVRVLIAGLGNSLLMDDGVGVHAVRELRHDPPPGASIVEIGTAVLDAFHLFESAETVLALDAVQAGGPPGTIYEVRPADGKEAGPSRSLHELDLRDAFSMLPAGKRPGLIILGVEPQRIDYGLELSQAVRKALPGFLDTVRSTTAALVS
jgi:hydrogenase maturation protease